MECMVILLFDQISMNATEEAILASQLDYTQQSASIFQEVSSVPVMTIQVLDSLMEDVKV